MLQYSQQPVISESWAMSHLAPQSPDLTRAPPPMIVLIPILFFSSPSSPALVMPSEPQQALYECCHAVRNWKPNESRWLFCVHWKFCKCFWNGLGDKSLWGLDKRGCDYSRSGLTVRYLPETPLQKLLTRRRSLCLNLVTREANVKT